MIALLILAGIVIAGLFYLYKKKGLSLTADEQLIVNALVTAEQKALDVFKEGKEEVLSEYETLKARVKNVVGLQAKLPVAPVTSSPLVINTLPPVP